MTPLAMLSLVAFLKAGEVWTVPSGGGNPTKITNTHGLVEDFRFSPQREYLAYSKRIKKGDERPISSIVIVRIATKAVVIEIKPDGGWIDIDRWLGTKLIYHSSAAMEVSGVFEFDAVRRTRRELDPNGGWVALGSDMSADGSLLAYADDVGLGPTYLNRLHFVETASGNDVIHVSRRSIMAVAIAPDKGGAAFVEVVDQVRDRGDARDRVWIYRQNAGESMIYEGPVRPKGGGSGLTWSPDLRYIAMNFGGRTTVLDTTKTIAPREFQGTDACWTGANQLAVTTAAGVQTIDVDSDHRVVLAAAAARSQCF